jgi:cyclic pyranopterin monophosphate synthase
MRQANLGRLPKGGVVEVARLAGIVAAKRTAEAIPLCHPIALEHVDVRIVPRADGFEVEAAVVTVARTGAEMEALHAVALAALTVYDMMKAVDRGIVVTDVRLVRKTGGTRGDYEAS